MNIPLKKIPFAVFPVSDIYAVYAENGKQFKYKVQAIACYQEEDCGGFEMHHLDFFHLNEGLHYPSENLPNFLGLIDGESNCIELDPKDYIKKG